MTESVGYYNFGRWRPKPQTESVNEELYEKDSFMCMKRRSSRIKYLIPTDDPELVRPGFLYIRRTSKGKEFVRNRRTTDDNMCPNCRRQSTRATALGQQEADIDARIAQLEAELKTTQEREQQERVGFRRPQPYQYTQAEETQSTPPPKIIDATPSPTSGRRLTIAHVVNISSTIIKDDLRTARVNMLMKIENQATAPMILNIRHMTSIRQQHIEAVADDPVTEPAGNTGITMASLCFSNESLLAEGDGAAMLVADVLPGLM